MKKAISALLIGVLLLSCLTVPAAAESSLPFELKAPGNFSARWLEGNDSPTTVQVAYSLTNEMTAFFQQKNEASENGTHEAFMSKYGYDDISITTQIDWAVDDVNDSVSGWHHNEYWDRRGPERFGFGYDEDGNYRVSEWDCVDAWVGNAAETVNTLWILRAISEDGLNGNPETKTPGIKDQLRPDQYSYRDGDLYIDFTAHTVYFRMRFVVMTETDAGEEGGGVVNKFWYSDWSETAAVGKDAVKTEPLSGKDLPAPVISGLRMTDKTFNGNPVVAFTLTVPDELAANAARVAASGGGLFIETEARVPGDAEWTLMGNTDHEVKAGEMECALLTLVGSERPVIPKDTVIELRCRYWCTQSGLDDVWSDYSKIISFGTDDITTDGGLTVGKAPASTDKCPLCHFCPQPLGLCIFIWLLILIVVIVVILILVRKCRKKEKRSENN